MGRVGAWTAERWAVVVRSPRSVRDWLRRARGYSGQERDVLLTVAKSAVAALVAWYLANDVLGWQEATFAPFSALLVVQSTVYRSVLASVRYVVAVIAGVGLSGVLTAGVGAGLPAFGLLMLAAVAIGQWRRFGAHGVQVATAAAFAYGAVAVQGTSPLGQILLAVLLGAGLGVAVNALLAPPLRKRGADQGVYDLSAAVRTLLTDMADGLRDGMPDPDTAWGWLYRAREMDRTVEAARADIAQGEESTRFNFRRPLWGTGRRFGGYRTTVESLARGGEQIRSIAAELDRAARYGDGEALDDGFRAGFARLLDVAAQAVRDFGRERDDRRGHAPDGLDGHLQEAWTAFDEVSRRTPGDDAAHPGRWPGYGALIVDAQRLVEDLDQSHRAGAVVPSVRNARERR
ncbi:MAG TPA: aromatic acid exporter family protein [Streptosporangiaceae bacterium]|jgi:hypothetical protein